ncbi:hypothetical protein E1A91_A11G302000v1 [Gossypium mustelinum]|uniref:RING-type domain-containing protein n=1 Tax=Gossypium mustelinum TaxID=34275 RepID=A0A5D2XCL3_GOSMU|nr:hypothetical protein E1A91_A11G302000v1 [Gossypium mustelinum]
MDDSCAVCADTLEWVAYGPCGHREVCSTCIVRLRFICDHYRCCLCKSELKTIFITKALGDYTKVINDFSAFPVDPIEGQVSSYWYHEGTQAYFDDLDHYKMIKAMCRLSCTVCDKKDEQRNGGSKKRAEFKNIEQLKSHLFNRHRLLNCSLCLEGRKVFMCEQKLYTREQLDKHIKTGDSVVDGTESERGGFTGHPMCEFCQNPFYGENELYLHMSTEHFTCHICQRRHPGQYEYYRNYDDMEIHFSREHHLCEDETCRAKKFVVFATQSELKRHNTLEHGGRMSRSKRHAALQIPISFRYRRSCGQDHPVRGHVSHPDSSDSQLSLAMQASFVTAGSFHSTSTSDQTVLNSEVASIVGPFEALATMDSVPSSRNCRALGNSRGGPLEDSSFPPLPAASNSSQQKVRNSLQGPARRSMAAPSRHRHNGTSNVVSNTAQGWPAVSFQPNMSAAGTHQSRTVTKFSHLSTTNNSSGSSKSKPTRIKESLPKVEDFQSANKALVEKIRVSLEFDQDKFSAFKGITGEYRQGFISTEEYLAYVHQFGLSHLVLELARLCPNVEKQRELVEIYNFNISNSYSRNDDAGQWKNDKRSKKGKEKCEDYGSTDSKHTFAGEIHSGVKVLVEDGHHSHTSKGKSKVLGDEDANSHVPPQSQVEPDVGGSKKILASQGGGNKQRKKVSKFLRNRLGDALAAQLEGGKCEIQEKTDENKEPPERLPVRSVWRDGGGQRLMAKTQRVASN